MTRVRAYRLMAWANAVLALVGVARAEWQVWHHHLSDAVALGAAALSVLALSADVLCATPARWQWWTRGE